MLPRLPNKLCGFVFLRRNNMAENYWWILSFFFVRLLYLLKCCSFFVEINRNATALYEKPSSTSGNDVLLLCFDSNLVGIGSMLKDVQKCKIIKKRKYKYLCLINTLRMGHVKLQLWPGQQTIKNWQSSQWIELCYCLMSWERNVISLPLNQLILR